MNNKKLAAIIIIFVSILLIVSVVGFFYLFGPVDTNDMKNQTFEGVQVTVPSNSFFIQNSNEFTDNVNGITMYTYVIGVDENFIKDLTDSEPILNNLTEINVTNLSENAIAFKWNQDESMTTIIVTNDKKDKAILILSVYDRDLAVKIADSVKFSN